MSPNKATLKILAEQGVTALDLHQIEKAKQLVDEVNSRLAAAGAPIAWCVMIVSATPARTHGGSHPRDDGPAEFSESGSAVAAGEPAQRPED